MIDATSPVAHRLRRAVPNLFTLGNALSGFGAVVALAGGVGPLDGIAVAVGLVAAGLVCDALDGRTARRLGVACAFGGELDSLADVITFGVAPAVLVYRWSLETMGQFGLAVAFVFVACGALRLARFNVLAMRADGKPSKHFIGLPIPIAANMLVAMVLTNHAVGINSAINHSSIAAVVAVLSYLMISRVRFRSMKDLRLSKRTIAAGAAIGALAVIVTARINAPFVFLGLIGLFIALGLAEEVVFYRRRRLEARATKAPAPPDDDESEVLAELGARG